MTSLHMSDILISKRGENVKFFSLKSFWKTVRLLTFQCNTSYWDFVNKPKYWVPSFGSSSMKALIRCCLYPADIRSLGRCINWARAWDSCWYNTIIRNKQSMLGSGKKSPKCSSTMSLIKNPTLFTRTSYRKGASWISDSFRRYGW